LGTTTDDGRLTGQLSCLRHVASVLSAARAGQGVAA